MKVRWLLLVLMITSVYAQCTDCDETELNDYYSSLENVGIDPEADDTYFDDPDNLHRNQDSSERYLQLEYESETEFDIHPDMDYSNDGLCVGEICLSGKDIPDWAAKVSFEGDKDDGKFVFGPRQVTADNDVETQEGDVIVVPPGTTLTDPQTGAEFVTTESTNIKFTDNGFIIEGAASGTWDLNSFDNKHGMLIIDTNGIMSSGEASVKYGDALIEGKFVVNLDMGTIKKVTLLQTGSVYSDGYGTFKGQGSITLGDGWESVKTTADSQMAYGEKIGNTRQHIYSGEFEISDGEAVLLTQDSYYRDLIKFITVSSVDSKIAPDLADSVFQKKKIVFGPAQEQAGYSVVSIGDEIKTFGKDIYLNVRQDSIYTLHDGTSTVTMFTQDSTHTSIDNSQTFSEKTTFALHTRAVEMVKLDPKTILDIQNANVISYINKDDKVSIELDKQSLALISQTDRFMVAGDSFILDLGDATFGIGPDFGMVYQEGEDTVEILSPELVRQNVGEELLDLKALYDKSDLNDKEMLSLSMANYISRQHLGSNDYDSAIDTIRNQLATITDPEIKNLALLSLGELIMAKSEDFSEAIDIYTQLKDEPSHSLDASLLLATAYMLNGDKENAQKEYENLRNDDDPAIKAKASIGIAQLKMTDGEASYALAWLHQAKKDDPDNPEVKSALQQFNSNGLEIIKQSIGLEKEQALQMYLEKLPGSGSGTTLDYVKGIFTTSAVDSVLALFTDHYENLETLYDGTQQKLTDQKLGVIAMQHLNKLGISLDQMSSISNEEIAKAYNLPESEDSSRAAFNIKQSIQAAFTNPDIIALTSGSGKFYFEEGKSYSDKEYLEVNWREMVTGQANLFMVGTTLGGGYAFSALAKGAKAIPGVTSVVEAGSATVRTLGETKLMALLTQEIGTGVSVIDKSLNIVGATGRFLAAEGAEEGFGFAVGETVGLFNPAAGEATQLIASMASGHAGIFDIGGSTKAVRRALVDADGNFMAESLTFDTKNQADSYISKLSGAEDMGDGLFKHNGKLYHIGTESLPTINGVKASGAAEINPSATSSMDKFDQAKMSMQADITSSDMELALSREPSRFERQYYGYCDV